MALVTRCILAGCPPGGLCLDPFAGSGTVPLVARALGRLALGVELSWPYLTLARNRLAEPSVTLRQVGGRLP
jgi:DNA modification methylase